LEIKKCGIEYLSIFAKEVYMSKFSLDPEEQEVGHWTTNFLPGQGGRNTGKLTITDKRVIFHAQYDTSLSGLVSEAIFYKFGDEGYFIIPRDQIKLVETKSSFINKRVILNLENGQKHTIDNGMLSIDKIVASLK
jgi:hypothetical protein